jgi:hypothetical protein
MDHICPFISWSTGESSAGSRRVDRAGPLFRIPVARDCQCQQLQEVEVEALSDGVENL